jgi:hypothetical protein
MLNPTNIPASKHGTDVLEWASSAASHVARETTKPDRSVFLKELIPLVGLPSPVVLHQVHKFCHEIGFNEMQADHRAGSQCKCFWDRISHFWASMRDYALRIRQFEDRYVMLYHALRIRQKRKFDFYPS